MDCKTTFRKKLEDELNSVIAAIEIDIDHVRLKYVEDKIELLSELKDFYTPELFAFKPFLAEFNDDEINEIVSFMSFLHKYSTETTPWSEIQNKARILLNNLFD